VDTAEDGLDAGAGLEPLDGWVEVGNPKQEMIDRVTRASFRHVSSACLPRRSQSDLQEPFASCHADPLRH
jgi:hypothetical protein